MQYFSRLRRYHLLSTSNHPILCKYCFGTILMYKYCPVLGYMFYDNCAMNNSGTGIWFSVTQARNLKERIRSLFNLCVNAVGRHPYCLSCMEVSYCTFRFGAIIQHTQGTFSLLCDSSHYIQYAWAISGYPDKATCTLNLCGGLSYQICGGTITHLHTWWQDGYCIRFFLNFL